jgi:antitoxin component HigA of HigAB toxin-antitoxin module/mRNA-degrading endonuclease HigB of HigAB toxin-antitoxin module
LEHTRIISRKRLREFGDVHPDAVQPLDDWYSLVKAKTYASPADVKADFASVSFISDDVTVFNIGGNKYRLSVSIRYQHRDRLHPARNDARGVRPSKPGRHAVGGAACNVRRSEGMTTLLDFSKPHVLRSDEEYEAAVAEIDALLDRDIVPGSEEEDRLEFLTLLVEAYDDEHFPMGGSSTPQSIVDFVLEQRGMQRSDLAEVMGGRSRVSDFFNGKRELSRTQIKALRDVFGIPADLLL